jgi:hypothetical protein
VAVELLILACMIGLSAAKSDLALTLVLVLFAPGATQWILVIPVAIYLNRRGKSLTLRGLLITAGVVALITGTCYGFLFYGG